MNTSKKKSVSRVICNNSIDYIKDLLDYTTNTKHKTLYTNYETKITTLVDTFLKTHSQLIENLFTIKNNLTFTLSYKEENLNNNYNNTINNIPSQHTIPSQYSIPSFIDIFRHLITINEFITQFTLDEQKSLKDNLSNNKTKKECYTFLNKSQVGTKLLTIYNSFIYTYPTLYTNLLNLFPSLEFHSLLINNFTSYKLLEEIELKIKKLITYSIVWKGKTYPNIVYVFMYDDKHTPTTKEQIETLGTHIIKRLLFFNEFLNTNHLPERFILFLTDKKKEIDKDLTENYHFKTKHVNTAVTNSRDIIIYRKEELFKSIFHEAIHFHHLDFRNLSSPYAKSTLEHFIKTHHINTDNTYLLYEAITETLANVLNSLYYSRDTKEMKLSLKNEIIFSTLQVSKILHLCNYSQWNDFSFNKSTNSQLTKSKTLKSNQHKLKSNQHKLKSNQHNNKKFKQDSCVFSYYVIKLYLLLNLPLYFKTILDKHLKFIETEKSFKQLRELIDVSRNNLLLKQFINSLLQGMNKKLTNNKVNSKVNSKVNNKVNSKKLKSKNITKYNTIKKTMRMTCNENTIIL